MSDTSHQIRESAETQDAVKEYARTLSWRMKATAGARFAAAERIAFQSKSADFLVAFLAGYVLVLTITPYIVDERAVGEFSITYLSVILSIMILIASLLRRDGPVLAEQFHRCALELNELVRKLELDLLSKGSIDIKGEVDLYNRTLQKFSINHDPVDFHRFQAGRHDEYPNVSRFKGFRYNVVFWFHKNFFNVMNFTAFVALLLVLVTSESVGVEV